jgi:RNA-directed DNA polymerase
MSKFENLKAAASLHDVARILGFKPKNLAYVLHGTKAGDRYKQFEIAKKNGGVRLISAPSNELKLLQRRLSVVLQFCIEEIENSNKIETVLAHGFRPKYSILTNAALHRNKSYVFNIDLENFFGSINFGRVRGFLITNKYFSLNPAVATVLAQIACHENALPQGSPCSPVFSNLIGHILDIRLAELANKTRCTYSRYADDITFSTNQKQFPSKVAKLLEGEIHQWEPGSGLKGIIRREGFAINNAKTRMQYKSTRQDVTGLIVNYKVNTRAEYRHLARAMVCRLLKTGKFQLSKTSHDASGKLKTVVSEGTINQLNGILSFIDSVNVHNLKKVMPHSEQEKPLHPPLKFSSSEKIYRDFLLYTNFFASPMPMILCEGKTDNVYLKAAIEFFGDGYPLLARKNAEGKTNLQVTIFNRTPTTTRLLGLSGGADQLKLLVEACLREGKYFNLIEKKQPVILLIDNDSGRNALFDFAKNKSIAKTKIDNSLPYIHVIDNFYIVPTPLSAKGEDTMIEDFFDPNLLKTIYNGKTFNPIEKTFDKKVHYPKAHFAEHVVKKNKKTIDFNGFKAILDRVRTVIEVHEKKSP